MKTINDLVELMTKVMLNESTKSYALKANVHFSIVNYFDESDNYEKRLISFTYEIVAGKNSKSKKVDILCNFENENVNQIQYYYWNIKANCRID